MNRPAWRDLGLATLATFGLGLFSRGARLDLWGMIVLAASLTAVCAAAGIIVGQRHGVGTAALTGGAAALACGNGMFGPVPMTSLVAQYLMLAIGIAASLATAATWINGDIAARRAAVGKPVFKHFAAWTAAVVIVTFTGTAVVLDPDVRRPPEPRYPQDGFAQFAKMAEYYTRSLEPQGDISASGLSFSVGAAAQTISRYSLELIVPRDRNRLYSTDGEYGQSQLMLINEQDSRTIIALDAAVPLKALAAELDRFGLSGLRGPSQAGVSAKLMLSREDGLTMSSDGQCSIYLLNRGRATILKPGEAAVISGRTVMLGISSAGSAAGSGAFDRLYILTALCDKVNTVGLTSAQQFSDVLAARIYDVDGDGYDETVLLTGSKSGPSVGEDRAIRVINGQGAAGTQALLELPRPRGTAQSTDLTLRDLNGDGRPEFLVTTWSGSPAVTVELSIYGFDGKSLRPLLQSAEYRAVPGLVSQCDADGNVRTSIPSSGLLWEYAYPTAGTATAPAVKPFRSESLCDFRAFDLADLDGDGKVEVIARQAISGRSSDEVLAYLRQVFAWDGQRFVRRDMRLWLTTFDTEMNPKSK